MKKVLKIIKNIVCCMLFFAITFSVVANASYAFRFEEDPNVSKFIRSFYAEDENSVDVAFVGSSALYRFCVAPVMYNSQKFTSSMYTCAAFPFSATLNVLKEIEKTQSPDVFVIDMRRFYLRLDNFYKGKTTSKAYLETAKSYFSALVNNMPISLERAGIIKKVVPDLLMENPLYWNFDYFRTHNNWRNMSLSDINNYINDWILNSDETVEQYKLEYKGASTVSKVEYFDAPDVTKFNQKIEISQEDLSVLDQIIEYIKQEKLNVLFVSTPCVVSKDLYAYEKFLQKYLENKDIDYLNCNDLYNEIGIDFSSDFYDSKHANTLGAIKFSEYLADYINSNYDFKPAALNELQRKEWEKAYKDWKLQVGNPGVEKITKFVAEQKIKGNKNY